jgi:hypothetical protein
MGTPETQLEKLCGGDPNRIIDLAGLCSLICDFVNLLADGGSDTISMRLLRRSFDWNN